MGLRTGSACILVIPPALAQFWRFARRYVGPALERAAFPGYALLLNDGRYALLRNAEAAQRIAGEAERQLARAHDREAAALTFEMGDPGFAVGPARGVDFGIELARGLSRTGARRVGDGWVRCCQYGVGPEYYKKHKQEPV